MSNVQYVKAAKSKGVAILLALLLGGIGGHKFYLGQVGRGMLYLLFCWTFIPAILALVDIVIMAMTPEKRFMKRYSA